MEDGEEQNITFARRAVVSRRLFFSHKIVRPLFAFACIDVVVALIFAIIPDTRMADSDQVLGIFGAQAVLAWINVVVSAALIALIFTTYSVTSRELTFERQSRIGYLIVVKVSQMLLAIALTAYPTFLRNIGGIGLGSLAVIQIAYSLYIIQRAREAFTRRIRPPLVIKALLDMKGEALGATKAQPLTLGMLERLEGIVKVKDQQKFNVRSGREYLINGVVILLIFSFGQWMWEFTKILTYQNRFFSRNQIAAIEEATNLPMYWPSRAFVPNLNAPASMCDPTETECEGWRYPGDVPCNPGDGCHSGGAGCQTSGTCEFPRTYDNVRLQPLPTGEQRVVMVVWAGYRPRR